MGRGVGALVGVLSAAAGWWAVYLQTGHTFSHPAIPYWNVAARLCLFLLAAFAVAALRRALVHARTDPLTGLPNSRAFHDAAETEIDRAHRYRRPFTIAVLDIDGFKRVNDQLGHARGDEVLKGVANALSGSLRASDVAARLGGDEFGLLLPEAGEEAARRALQKVLAALTAGARGLRPEVGFSIGAATFTIPPASLLVALVRADELMYSAKRSPGSGIRHEALPLPRPAKTA
jgi:diguanylate cyclase (GGDEF)-like protein